MHAEWPLYCYHLSVFSKLLWRDIVAHRGLGKYENECLLPETVECMNMRFVNK